ncbi:putative methionine synthase [Secundilactobacillus oryzae JCM 18671]|uniref:Putative methionine synthase n=1 Tax=Secundilactobacillus oryzae JCM 18671 TaxID=1291743 RepID=A0A081BH29_9LACO|nr:putative methionine synthase [Secundilactobacillus oryzae JCM 18671]
MTVDVKVKFPYRYDEVGSLLRQESLKKAREDFKTGKIDVDALHQVEDKEVQRIINKQVDLGYKAVTDGEFRRSWWHLDFFDGLKGAHFFEPEKGFIFHGLETRKGGVKITDKLAYNPEHPFFADFTKFQATVPEGITAK